MILTTIPRSSLFQQNNLFPNHQFSDLPLNEQTLDSTNISNLGDLGRDLNFELDLDDIRSAGSNASSPTSTQSLLSQLQSLQSSSLSTLDNVPTIAIPRGAGQRSLFRASGDHPRLSNVTNIAPFSSNVDSMHVEPWLHTGQLTPKSTGRAYSLSPGSAGPASPYSQNTSNPQIAVTDVVPDGLPNISGSEDFHYQITSKPFPASHDQQFYANYPNYTYHAPTKSRLGASRSRPLSGASSVASDSPATPAGEPDDDSRRQKTCEQLMTPVSPEDHILSDYSPLLDNAAFNPVPTVPKLDRTMTDVYGDELYSPNFTVGATSSGQMPSPNNELFVQRLQAANSQHLNAVQSSIAIISRGRSPFRNGSPLAPAPSHDFSGALVAAQTPFHTEKHLREQRKAAQDAQVMQNQFGRGTDTSTPQTISPKDAVLDYHESEGDANFPLFPQHETSTFDADDLSKAVAQSQQTFGTSALDGATFGGFLSPQIHTAFQIPQQYPFVTEPSHANSSTPVSNQSAGSSRLGSSELHSDSTHPSSPMRPSMTGADGGTYTCTYHGCTLRFDTPALLQKHKREGHRQAHGLVGTTLRVENPSAGSGMTSSFLNTQAGPHRCERINPSTGKPCNTVFSRPYDLTRHEDTIHNARKQKVRCDLCTDEKTFSRADALTRHYRVCHPDIEFPGKHRRRGGHGI